MRRGDSDPGKTFNVTARTVQCVAVFRAVTLPPAGLEPDGAKPGGWWHTGDDGRIVCDLCPRACQLPAGARGFCFVRENRAGRMVLGTYGRSTGFCVDPIEKKPLNHFLPGTSVLSFGTAGCNLGCQFCQNWSISKSREVEALSESATPEAVAAAAQRLGCASVAFTYNDPVIWAEYAIDVAAACHAAGVKTVAVTAGYITPAARGPFFAAMHAANVDLKAFSDEFYQRLTLARLAPVLDTLAWLRAETNVWFEITNLVIPRANDGTDELARMCEWILRTLGDEVPVHFTAFHPDFRLRDRERTPHATLCRAYDLARRAGLKYVYVGNVNDVARQSTYCPGCGTLVIERDWYALGRYELRGGCCGACGAVVAGRFDDAPGTWGRRRLPVRIAPLDAGRPDTSPQHATRTIARERTRPIMLDSSAPTTITRERPTMTTPERAVTPTPAQERALHRAACEIVAAATQRRPARLGDPSLGGSAGLVVHGLFVSLKRRDQLRGCCGVVGAPTTIADALERAAHRTAVEDARLPAVSASELAYLDLEVWLLGGATPIAAQGEARRDHVEIGRHGLTIRRGSAAGLLLPGVAVDAGLDAERFLEQVCVKAGLPPTAWKERDVEVSTFEGRAIGGPFDREVADAARVTAVVTADGLARLAAHCAESLEALRGGRLAACYAPDAPDGTVHAISLAVRRADGEEALRLSRLSLRPGVPLQATLFGLVEQAARHDTVSAAERTRIELTVLWDPAMHGTANEPDLRGFDPSARALLVIEDAKAAWRYVPDASTNSLLAAVSEDARVRDASGAFVLSLAAASTTTPIAVSDVPRPRPGLPVRRPAVAGTFYPAGAPDLSRTVDALLAEMPRRPERRAAVMVPHAALRYSGRVAAAAYARVEIPDVVIVLAPRHHRLGAEWAVAPHERWSLPGLDLASDPTLARALAEAIPDLELDALAHEPEHAIEVQLPLLARLAPRARVVGIALGAGDAERCHAFASGLVQVLRARREPPLLVISTDLNHYASDAENRRLDAVALDCVERLAPADVYRTVRERRISMCGLLPTVVVLDTLEQLGIARRPELIAYATSADAPGGDASRVVGYAGMLLG